MSNYSNLKSSINNNIYENQTQQITGTVLNAILNEMTNALGAGYQFAGVATVGMTPSEPDARIFYLAGEGIYTSFDGIQVPAGKLGILKWDTRWHLETIDGLGSGGANLTGYVTVASTDDLPDEGVATLGYLCGENLYLYVGEGGDTKEGKYQNCGSFRGPQGDSVQDVEQTQTSLENGGINKIKFTLSNGISCEFQVRNGTTSSGLFPTLADLQAAYPSPVVGQYAFVGSGFPADIYVCTTAGTWTDSGEDYDGDNVDLTDYATKSEVNQLELEVDVISPAMPVNDKYCEVVKGGFDSSGNAVPDSSSANIICITYIPITSQPTIVVRESGTQKTIGYRYYDSSKSYLGSSYSSSASFVRFIALSTSTNVTVTVNGEAWSITQKYAKCASEDKTKDGFIDMDREVFAVDANRAFDIDGQFDFIPKSYDIEVGHFGTNGQRDPVSVILAALVKVPASFIGKKISATGTASSKQYGFVSAVSADKNTVTWVAGTGRVSAYPDEVEIPSGTNWLYITCGTTTTPASPTIEVVGGIDIKDAAVTDAELFDYSSVNLFDPSRFKYDRRLNASGEIVSNSDIPTMFNSGLVPVTEGKTYTVSGDGVRGVVLGDLYFLGAYFGATATGAIGENCIAKITFVTPVDEVGKYFTVPSGQDIKFAIVSLYRSNTSQDEPEGNTMMNEGEIALPYQQYQPVPKVKESLLPDSGSSIGNDFVKQWLSMPSGISYGDAASKIASFREHWMKKDKDLVILNTGTSLTARSNDNGSATLRPDAEYRPPLMQSNNYASLLWDKIAWERQEYRRFDAKTEKGGNTPMFTESGSFNTAESGLSGWDDYTYRAGYTRYASATSGAGVSFHVPVSAWQFNFIFRTASNGCQSCSVAVDEGNGYMEVWNGASWVEANGYTFSMKESAASSIPSVTCILPDSESEYTFGSYQTKGNTTYQKRLKMRAVAGHRDTEKTVTISATETDAVFMYWGVEWSPREYMLTFINAARGSHNPLISSDALSLTHYQDNEVWEFKPDLIFTENPIINCGSSRPGVNTKPTTYWGRVTSNFFFDATVAASMMARATAIYNATYANGIEWVIFNTSPTRTNSFDENEQVAIAPDKSGNVLTYLDCNQLAHEWIMENKPGVVSINAARFWAKAAMDFFGNIYDSTRVTSSESNNSFSVDGTHWNELGCKVMAKCILPVLDLIL